MDLALTEEDKNQKDFFNRIRQPLKFRLFLLKNLPAALFSGVSLVAASPERSIISVPYRWFTRNPFRSTYFACLSMAAEMSTGILAMSCVYRLQPAMSLLVIGMEGNFYKKATGITSFICEEGNQVRQVVKEAAKSGMPQTIKIRSLGVNEKQEPVAEFYITWSFKSKLK